jgi:RNA polymerase subunit RPABC4/transcription elongation factor Spt4
MGEESWKSAKMLVVLDPKDPQISVKIGAKIASSIAQPGTC